MLQGPMRRSPACVVPYLSILACVHSDLIQISARTGCFNDAARSQQDAAVPRTTCMVASAFVPCPHPRVVGFLVPGRSAHLSLDSEPWHNVASTTGR